jgi:16S rRNA (guanine(966)-N(2))-methyltransferase RsmD
LRIITGIKRGLKLNVPKNNEVRPTLDRIKESIFNIIMPIKENAIVLDLFAGTGNIGLEFISRGAKKVYFVDNSIESINLIKSNVEKCRFEENSELVHAEYEVFLNNYSSRGIEIDYIYIDPPYGELDINIILKNVLNSNIISNNSLIIYEDDTDRKIKNEKFTVVDERKYGNIYVKFLKKR